MERAQGEVQHIYTDMHIHVTLTNTHSHDTRYIFLNVSNEKRATLLFELRVQQRKVLAIHKRSKNVI